MVTRENLKNMSRWSGIVGMALIILGIFDIFVGLFTFFVGAIPGIIVLFLGIKLWKARKHANEALYIDDNSLQINRIFENLNSYFKIQGIIIIIGAIFAILGILGIGNFTFRVNVWPM